MSICTTHDLFSVKNSCMWLCPGTEPLLFRISFYPKRTFHQYVDHFLGRIALVVLFPSSRQVDMSIIMLQVQVRPTRLHLWTMVWLAHLTDILARSECCFRVISIKESLGRMPVQPYEHNGLKPSEHVFFSCVLV